jgi:hypothetical protein
MFIVEKNTLWNQEEQEENKKNLSNERFFIYDFINSSDCCSGSGSGYSVCDEFLESIYFLKPSKLLPIPTKTIDCDITSIDVEINIFSIHPRRKHRVPTKQITSPAKAVPEVFPFPLETISDQENFCISSHI